MLVLLGSRALEILHPGALGRKLVDYDFQGSMDEISQFCKQRSFSQVYPAKQGRKIIARSAQMICEFEITWEGSTAEEFVALAAKDGTVSTILGIPVIVPSLNLLYAMKLSHRYLKNSPHFLKTMRDLQKMKALGAVLESSHQDWFKRREKETYNYSHPKLDTTKENFFKGDGVQYVYDHDTIHESMAHLERPAYTFYMKDGEQVKSDRKKFEALPLLHRLYGVLEEAYVLALERSQIPHAGKVTPQRSFEIAIMKVCTSITSGWFRAFAYDHYDEVMALYSNDYVERFQRALAEGRIKPFTGSQY